VRLSEERIVNTLLPIEGATSNDETRLAAWREIRISERKI
jgi:hypothetical protein